jgi:hypothetical protein
MKRYLALFLLLALLLAGCVPEAPSSTAPTTSATEPSSSVPEKATEPTTDPISPPPEEPKNTTETEVSDDGTIVVTTTDPAGKVLSWIVYDPYADTTEKTICEYSENGFAMLERSYFGGGNLIEEFAADNYENSTDYFESVPVDAYVDPANAFSVTIEEFAPLYRQAEEIWNTYGVVVLIADKLTENRGNAELCLEYEWIEPNLDIIENCLAVYPTDFFRYFDRTMCIQLAGFNGNYAGTYYPDERIDMVQIDAYSYQPEENGGFDQYARGTLHHELCHAIDQQLHDWAEHSELPFTEEHWNTLNPEGFTYVGWHDFELEAEKYNDGENYKYFISGYSCYDSGEDRATLFETAMTDSEYAFTDELKAKLQYFSDCIRAAFPSDDWHDVLPWEYALSR